MFKKASRWLQTRCNKRTQPNHYKNILVNGTVSVVGKVAMASLGITPVAGVTMGLILIGSLVWGMADQDGMLEQYLGNALSSVAGTALALLV